MCVKTDLASHYTQNKNGEKIHTHTHQKKLNSQPTVATLTGSAVEQNDTEDAEMRMMVIIRKRVDKENKKIKIR